MNLSGFITDSQIQEIICTILNACIKYREFNKQCKDLFYEPYTTMRKKFSVTSAVLSAFSPIQCHITGFSVRNIYYGLHNQLAQPELMSDNAVLQIYSNGSDLKSNPIKENSKKYNCDLTTKPIFLVVVFFVNKESLLSKIQIKLPNADGEIIEEETIYEIPKCIEIAI